MKPKKVFIICLIIGIGIMILGIIQNITSSDYAAGRGVIFLGIFVIATSGFYYYNHTHDIQYNFNKILLFAIVTTLEWGILLVVAGIWDCIWGDHMDQGAELLFTGIGQLTFVIFAVSLHSKFPSLTGPIPNYMNPNP